MSNAKIVIRQPGVAVRKISISSDDGDISIGRAPDNVIYLEGDTDASRYHAVIEARGGSFFVSDLGSTNGTTVNRRSVNGEYELRNGDLISVGGSSTIEFRIVEDSQASEYGSTTTAAVAPAVVVKDDSASRASGVARRSCLNNEEFDELGRTGMRSEAALPQSAPPPPQASTFSPLFIAAGTVLLLGFIVGIGLLVYNIITPPNSGPPISASPTPFVFNSPTPGPTQIAGNNTITPSPEVTPAASPDASIVGTTPPPGSVDIGRRAENLALQLSGRPGYTFDPEFVNRIRAEIAQYRGVNFYPQAYQNRFLINSSFGGTKALYGYVLALSRSRFDANASDGGGVGLWQVPPAVVQNEGYLVLNAGESAETALRDPARSAQVAGRYFEAVLESFDNEDFMYAIASFGTPRNEVGQLVSTLAQRPREDRLDFWKMVRSGVVSEDKAARVVRFFAAGIISENPREFGLSNPPFSSLN